jgi:lipopolysaccharide export system permease protein
MRRRQPLSLWLYILGELWRLILLTLGILVLVLAFAVAVKPLADGKIGPIEALRFMALAVIPMTQYALPFAAGFGATLAYHRLSTDNEITAAHASGVSHRSILAPALISGIILAGVLLAASQLIIPRFLRSMEQMVTQDIARILMNSIERGQSVAVGDKRVYADSVVRIDPSPDSGATDEFRLANVCVLFCDPQGRVRQDITASRAHVWVMPGSVAGATAAGADPAGDSQTSTVIIRVEDFVGYESRRGFVSSESYAMPLAAGKSFKDDPKFLTFDELRRLRREPERMNWIDSLRADLATRMLTKLVSDDMIASLDRDRTLRLTDAQDRRVAIKAASMVWNAEELRWDLAPLRPGGPIDVALTRDDRTIARLAAREAALYPSYRTGAPEERLVFELRVRNAVIRGDDGSDSTAANGPNGGTTVPERLYPDLRFASPAHSGVADRRQTPVDALVDRVNERVARGDNDPWLTDKRDELVRKVDKLHREITSKQHERFAMALACLVMVVTGAVTAVKLSTSLPLTVYLWSFFPALAALITISSGQQLTHDKGLWGLLVLWGGVGILGVYGAMVYARMARH